MGKREIIGSISIVIGVISILTNRQGAQMYVEYGKWWGVKSPYSLGRFISIFGGVVFVLAGLLILFATAN